MARILAVIIVMGLLCGLAVLPAAADRLILTPTGTTLTTGGLKAEFATSPDADNAKAYWLNVGVSRVEIEGARFQDFGPDDFDAISAQVSVLPETSFTPAVALGIRDISDKTEGKGVLYDGQSIYLAASKSVPFAEASRLFEDIKLHGGIGSGELSGVFFGVEGKLSMGLDLIGEYDTEDFNFAAQYKILPAIKIRAASIKGDSYYSLLFSTAF
jgi:hypothetical protein